jgi:hypothetical protein
MPIAFNDGRPVASSLNFFGTIDVDVEAELAKLNEHGLRPLRAFGFDEPL